MAEDEPVAFSGLLRRLRAGARLTQEELASAASLSRRAVSDLERGVATTPQKETVRLLADALHLIGPERAQFEAAARGRPLLSAPAAAMRSLPRDVASFTGRQRELEQLSGTTAGAGGVVNIHAIGGMAGVGKTAFAVHAGHRLARAFPDGQIFVLLHGHTPGRRQAEPADVLAGLLLTIGVPAAQIPPGLEARMALWRDRAAGKQLLLVLDDAASSEQVRPLLPGAGESLVLVTSRQHLSALDDVNTISLDTLPPGEAAALLVSLSGRAGLNPDDPAVADISRMCGYLPLAIGMVARQLRHHPAWTAAGRAVELAAARDRLELMATENASVAAAFDLSYAILTEDQRRLFRRLGLHPGADIDGYSAAALDGADLSASRRGLEALYDQNLLTEPTQGRYRMHDLIRAHARSLAAREDSGTDRDQANARLMDYYQHTAARAGSLIARQTRPTPAGADGALPAAVPAIADTEQALAWARTERASLLACLDHATRAGQHARVMSLTAGIAGLLRRDGPWAEAITRHSAAIEAARHISDRLGEANALSDLGEAQRLTGDYRGAADALEQALGIYRDLGDLLGEANALSEIGAVQRSTSDFATAAHALELALGIYGDLGDRRGQANTLSEIGAVRSDFPAALQALEEALGIYGDLGDRRGQANTLNFLGAVRCEAEDYPAAARAQEQALAICRDLGDRLGQAHTLKGLGTAQQLMGDYLAAAQALEQSLGIYRDIGHRPGEGGALRQLGTVRQLSGDYAAAALSLEQALAICRDLGDRLGQAGTLHDLAIVRRLTCDYPAAADTLELALGIFRDIGHRSGEGRALNEKGTLYRVRGELALADGCHRQALELARASGSLRDEASALAGLGHTALVVGDSTKAGILLRQALEIFQLIGAAEAQHLQAELESITCTQPAQ
ncbi:MAG TPA: tetratricopeptide repeat protein [Streptosporangiaceae bacterium]|nr:tetratricopeptide repeat protein [Streptosporangiaceae bacterium]